MADRIRTAAHDSAVRAALNRAKAHAGTAAIAALLAPLGAANATVAPQSSISTNTSTVAGVTTYSYTVSNTSTNPAYVLYEFELPEFHSGDFNLASFVGPGWTVTEETTPTFSTTGFKSTTATPGAYVLFQTMYSGIHEGNFQTFSLASTVAGSTNVNFTTAFGVSEGVGNFQPIGTQQVDPPVPGPAAAAIPEPVSASLLFGGLGAALVARRRRKT